ncbi:hypothetical protein ASD21_19265 [Caulobacter sp. Root1455]|uniref:hypothetical protein n=1 Tax=Caulobacter sp. Root1455 TaxID=1736465 RepID=UPI0006FCD3A9|nr:hypothetical protein [Caulobacter sp. Root1455]KQZ04736.1 hypothetical protein ASD21_19265 [Caulobacter sp. Root1455]
MTPDSTTFRWTADPTVGERLLLGAMRQWAALKAAGEPRPRLVAQALAFRASHRSGGLFVAWMQSVEASLRRPIQVERPTCGGVSTDEQRLMASCGLAGTATAAGAALLEPLLIDSRPTMALARALNAALRVDGYPLPVRLREPQGAGPDEPAPRWATVH